MKLLRRPTVYESRNTLLRDVSMCGGLRRQSFAVAGARRTFRQSDDSL